MSRITHRIGPAIHLLILLALLPIGHPPALGNEDARVDGQAANVPYTLLRPGAWNGDLVLLVHGSIPAEFEGLGQALATLGFGVAFVSLPESIGDGAALKIVTLHTRLLQAQFTSQFGAPDRVFLMGFSRGAHNMTRLLETSPVRYSGMLSICGGNGGAQRQWDYFLTARVLFDYYFPTVLPGTPLQMPALGADEFFGDIAPDVIDAILANLPAALEMASVEQYGLQYASLEELVSGILLSLWIHSVGVNDLVRAANGNPFDNASVVYGGTGNDEALNTGILRLSADPSARNYLRTWYEPDGSIGDTPVLLVHTARDPVVPEIRNNGTYQALVETAGSGDFLVRRVLDRFGHCSLSPEEIIGSLVELVAWVESGIKPTNMLTESR